MKLLKPAPKHDEKATILLCSNSAWNLANFRRPIIEALVADGYRVVTAAPPDGSERCLIEIGADFRPLPIKASGRNPFADAWLLLSAVLLIRRERPSVVFTFTIKPNIYGSLAAGWAGVKSVATISGLGSSFLAGGRTGRLIERLYRRALSETQTVFFQNDDDRSLFVERGLVAPSKVRRVPGSGVDLDRFAPCPLPSGDRPVFLLIGRLLGDKGVREFAAAAREILNHGGPSPRFQILGGIGVDNPSAVPISELERWVADGTIEHLGEVEDVRPAIGAADCVVLPSYREGLPRSLLEGAAMGRPLIATDVPGCREVIEHGVNGLLCEPRSVSSLADGISQFLAMTEDERREMGCRGRELVERKYSTKRVVEAYREELRP